MMHIHDVKKQLGLENSKWSLCIRKKRIIKETLKFNRKSKEFDSYKQICPLNNHNICQISTGLPCKVGFSSPYYRTVIAMIYLEQKMTALISLKITKQKYCHGTMCFKSNWHLKTLLFPPT